MQVKAAAAAAAAGEDDDAADMMAIDTDGGAAAAGGGRHTAAASGEEGELPEEGEAVQAVDGPGELRMSQLICSAKQVIVQHEVQQEVQYTRQWQGALQRPPDLVKLPGQAQLT